METTLNNIRLLTKIKTDYLLYYAVTSIHLYKMHSSSHDYSVRIRALVFNATLKYNTHTGNINYYNSSEGQQTLLKVIRQCLTKHRKTIFEDHTTTSSVFEVAT